MRGTEKQIKWAEELMAKMHKEFDECKKIAPENVHSMFDKIESILNEGYAGDIIDLLKNNHDSGQEYFSRFATSASISGCVAAMKIKKELRGVVKMKISMETQIKGGNKEYAEELGFCYGVGQDVDVPVRGYVNYISGAYELIIDGKKDKLLHVPLGQGIGEDGKRYTLFICRIDNEDKICAFAEKGW